MAHWFSEEDQGMLEGLIKRIFIENIMLCRQTNNERLYMKSKALRQKHQVYIQGVYKKIKLRAACYIIMKKCEWIRIMWKWILFHYWIEEARGEKGGEYIMVGIEDYSNGEMRLNAGKNEWYMKGNWMDSEKGNYKIALMN